MMNSRKLIRFTAVLLLLLCIGLLTACSTSQLDTGSLTVALHIPDDHPTSVTLSKIVVAVKKDSTTTTKEFDFLKQDLEAPFKYLESGKWLVEVTVLDTERYAVYKGTETVTITAGQTLPASIDLDLIPGSLEITVEIPDTVTSGEACLENYAGNGCNLTSPLTIDAESGLATAKLDNLNPITCNLKIQLYNGTKPLNPGRKEISILPGRTIKAEFNVSVNPASI